MSNPSISDTAQFWSQLIELNKQADALIERVQRAVEPTQPISREIPFYASIEARFENLPASFSDTPANNSDALFGNNIKRPIWTNHSSRVYIRELSFQAYYVAPADAAAGPQPRVYEARFENNGLFPFNWRWNFQTSITQQWYSQKRGVLAAAGGRSLAGNHLSFREPRVVEPMETFTYECELLSFDSNAASVPLDEPPTAAVISMILSGYREGF
jgi:hypothetical protein